MRRFLAIGFGVMIAVLPVVAQAGVERHDPFLRCLILLAIAEETDGAGDPAALATIGELLRAEGSRMRTEEADGGELIDRYVVILKQIQAEGALIPRANRDEAEACARARGIEVRLKGQGT